MYLPFKNSHPLDGGGELTLIQLTFSLGGSVGSFCGRLFCPFTAAFAKAANQRLWGCLAKLGDAAIYDVAHVLGRKALGHEYSICLATSRWLSLSENID